MSNTFRSRDAEGWPMEDYFAAVDKALADSGIEVIDGTSDGRHDFTYRIGSPIPGRFGKFYIGWSVDEHCDPLSEIGFTGHGWLWVGHDADDDSQRTVGHFVVDAMAEPDQVALVVAEYLRGAQ